MAKSQGVRVVIKTKYLISQWLKLGILPKLVSQEYETPYMLEYRPQDAQIAICDTETITIQQIWCMNKLQENINKATNTTSTLSKINYTNDGKWLWINEIVVVEHNALPVK